MSALESRQNTLDVKMTEVLTSTAAATEAVQELTSMFSKYFVKMKDSETGNPSMSKSALDNHSGITTTLLEPGSMHIKEEGSNRPMKKGKGCMDIELEDGSQETKGTVELKDAPTSSERGALLLVHSDTGEKGQVETQRSRPRASGSHSPNPAISPQ
jgi:hypothetical protein